MRDPTWRPSSAPPPSWQLSRLPGLHCHIHTQKPHGQTSGRAVGLWLITFIENKSQSLKKRIKGLPESLMFAAVEYESTLFITAENQHVIKANKVLVYRFHYDFCLCSWVWWMKIRLSAETPAISTKEPTHMYAKQPVQCTSREYDTRALVFNPTGPFPKCCWFIKSLSTTCS